MDIMCRGKKKISRGLFFIIISTLGHLKMTKDIGSDKKSENKVRIRQK